MTDMLLEGRSVLVTGASRGIGRAVALACARAGADVALNHWRDAEAVAAVADEIAALGRRAIVAEGDVADEASAPAFVAAAVEAFGKVDVLVSNAGICPFHGFLDMPADLMRRTTEVNYFGTFYMAQAAANRMKAQGAGGAIVAMSSISALVGGGSQTHYTPTKAAIHSLMQSCAIALGPSGIRCNSILVGTVETDINKDDLSDPGKRAAMTARVPLGRLGRPDDIAEVAVFLASDMARYMTGSAVLVDGGAYVNLQ
ncbi:SDR family NAD(P)-dependent oxidoreductase [Methylobacterium frigidaeris]|nr:SDR family NAD(P)-dependent oxidoreductase [Methylobacterium frigidaeris]